MGRNCPYLLLMLYKAWGLFVIQRFLQRCYLSTTVRCLLIRVTCELRLRWHSSVYVNPGIFMHCATSLSVWMVCVRQREISAPEYWIDPSRKGLNLLLVAILGANAEPTDTHRLSRSPRFCRPLSHFGLDSFHTSVLFSESKNGGCRRAVNSLSLSPRLHFSFQTLNPKWNEEFFFRVSF